MRGFGALSAVGIASVALAAAAAPFDLEAHRGGRGLWPENTVAAFAHAIALGVTTLELDTAITRDGAVVVSHDSLLNPDLTRDAAGRWLEAPGPPIFQLTLAALRGYDVGRLRPRTAYAARFPGQLAVDGQRLPTLAEVLALGRRAGGRVRFNVETKLDPRRPEETAAPEPFVTAVIGVVRAAGMAKRVMLQSFDWRTLRIAHRIAPEIPTVCLTTQHPGDDNVQAGVPGPSPWLDGLDVDDFGGSVPRLVHAAGCRVWSPDARDVSAAAVADAHAQGLTVVTWTVNEEAEMDALITAGVDGIISDYPDRLRAVTVRHGLALPQGERP